ncbi:hypothetical protein VTP01DRAFT_983 [Rhizomucor pusillus]|uniref:uncharacterized protein n=1 Tax=Rhizomucor pusillus TaxID=4840 RepID=UPI003743783F
MVPVKFLQAGTFNFHISSTTAQTFLLLTVLILSAHRVHFEISASFKFKDYYDFQCRRCTYVDELGNIRHNKRMRKTFREYLRLYGRFKPETLGLAAFPISNSIPRVQFESSASRVMTEVAVEECGPEMEVDQEESEPSIMQASNVPFDDIDNAFGAEENSEDSAEEYLVEEFWLANDDDYLRGGTAIAIEEIYTFIMIFLAHFPLRFLSETAAELLMQFVNALLEFSQGACRLSTKLSTLGKQATIGSTTKGVKCYIVCPQYHKNYVEEELPLDRLRDPVEQMLCTHKKFPRNVASCGDSLFKRSSGNKHVPIKVYAYNSVESTLSNLFNRPDFIRKINHWRSRTPHAGRQAFNYAYFKRGLVPTFLNWTFILCRGNLSDGQHLPPDERYKPENVILVGVMPGSKEPSKQQINHYLEPLVDELLKLYTAVNISIDAGTSAVRVRATLFMVACDIPAARKVSGFTGIGSFCACHRCKRHFPSAPDNPLKRDLSGFRAEDLQTCIPRTKEDNKRHAEAWRNACTYEERSILEREHGTRWSQLHRLPYFDPVRCTVIDPMHNLCSGTTKRAMNFWTVFIDSETKKPLLSPQVFQRMAEQMQGMILPRGYDLPKGKVTTGCLNLTSDEWRTWVLGVSSRLLKEKLVGAHMRTWLMFVQANYLL